MDHKTQAFHTEEHPLPEGLAITLCYQDQVLSLPLVGLGIPMRQLVNDACWPKLALLDELWHQQRITSYQDGQYLLPWTVYFTLGVDDFEGTHWPVPVRPGVSLFSTGSITQSRFRIRADVRYQGHEGNLLLWGRRYGPWIVTDKGPVVIDALTYRLLTLLDQPVPMRLEEKMAWVAEIKEVAGTLGANLDTYLTRENYVLVDDFEIQPVLDDPEHLHCDVQYHDERLDEGVLRQLSKAGGYVEARQGAERRRIVAKKVTKERVQQLRTRSLGIRFPNSSKIPKRLSPRTFRLIWRNSLNGYAA